MVDIGTRVGVKFNSFFIKEGSLYGDSGEFSVRGFLWGHSKKAGEMKVDINKIFGDGFENFKIPPPFT